MKMQCWTEGGWGQGHSQVEEPVSTPEFPFLSRTYLLKLPDFSDKSSVVLALPAEKFI